MNSIKDILPFSASCDLYINSYNKMFEEACLMITDYSSSIWDYSLLKKPGFLFVPDLEYYEENNGLCTPIEKWGFAVCKTNEELKQKIHDYDQKEQIRAISENHKLFHSYETGKACEYVYDYIISKI